MPRPRTIDDSAIFLAAGKVMSRFGPAKLTLGRIAKECGLAAPTLVQRFGSKTGLLRAMSKTARGESLAFVDELKARVSSPLGRVREFVLCFAGLAPTPEALTNNTLAYLQIDLADPVMRRHLGESGREQEAALAQLVEAAIASGELSSRVKPRELAQVLNRLASGSLLAWALYRAGTARDWLSANVDAVLRPLRAK